MKITNHSLSGKNPFLHTLLCFALPVSLLLGGCGNSKDSISTEIVELHEPLADSSSVYAEPVHRRNLYQASIYETDVSPYVEEYSFETTQLFNRYCILPGNQVKQGDVLVRAIGDTLSDKIENAEKYLEELKEDFEKYRGETEKTLAEQREELEFLEQVLSNLETEKPQEYLSGTDLPSPDTEDTLPDSGENLTTNPDYLSWLSQYNQWEGKYNLTEYYIAVGERELQLRQDLFQLDYNYYNNELKKLLKQRQEEVITSQISGTVVGIGTFVYGDRISGGTPVIAVGDTSRKMLSCSYIAERILDQAQAFYAFINGKRYEVTAIKNDSLARSLFLLEDEKDEVPMGSYAVLVVMHDYRNQVLTVPLLSLYKENSGNCVYVMKDNVISSRAVETGINDGVYVEILSGLEEGEQVISLSEAERTFSTSVLEKGGAGIPYQVKCDTFLPLKTVVYNSIENGTVFMKEYLHEIHDYVKKGDVIATISVESDVMDISRRETALSRSKERLADLIAENNQANEESIKEMQENIRIQEEELANRKKAYAATEIVSPTDGYLEYLYSTSSGEIIRPNTRMAFIAEKSIIYLSMLPHYENIASFGNVLELEYYDDDHKLQSGYCKAITLRPSLLSKELGECVLLEPYGEATENNSSVQEGTSSYIALSAVSRHTVTGVKKDMDNVILVPKKAVSTVAENYGVGYVDVLTTDGSIVKMPFLMSPSTGGENNQYYWAIDGLTEGMEVICWE